MDAPIVVEGLSKRYRLGAAHQDALKGVLESAVRAPARWLRRGETKEEVPEPQQPREFWALRDVSLEVKQGEVFGLVGANGAGKSTLLKLLARITSPTEGQITMRGRIGSLLEIGTGFHPELTGRENVFLNGAVLGMARREIASRYDEIVDFSGIGKFIDTPVKRYSSGMYLRLAFAVSSFLDTDVLLLDEVLAVGDAEFQSKSMKKIEAAQADGRTTVFCSHDLSNVIRLCDRCAWVEGGRIREIGPTKHVIGQYLNQVGDTPQAGEAFVTDEIWSRSSSLEGAKLHHVAMRDPDDRLIEHVHFGQPLTVDMTLDVEKPLDGVVFEVGIGSVDGTRVLTAHNTDWERPALSFSPGRHRVRVDLDMILLPGEFTIDLGVHDTKTQRSYDWVERILTFGALNEPVSGGDRYPWPEVRGSVRPASEWSTQPQSEKPTTVSTGG